MENNKQIELIKTQSFSLPDEAKYIIITDDKSLKEANYFYQNCKLIIEKIHNHMDPIRKATHKAWKESIAQIDRLEEPLLRAMKTVKPKMIAYKLKVQEEIQKKEAKAQAEIEAEKKEQDRLLQEATALEETGDKVEADEKLEEAVSLEDKVKESIQKMATIPKAPETKGMTMRKIPKWKLINFDDVPVAYLKLDEVKIGAAVRASKGIIKIPGIEVYFETV